MSHFPVLVICNEPEEYEELLAPYQENSCSTPSYKYMEFNDMEEANREAYETENVKRIKAPDGKLLSPYMEQFRVMKKDRHGLPKTEFEYPKGYEMVEVPAKGVWPDISGYLEEFCGYEVDEITGKHGYWENPNAKWDWYTEGGRWKEYMKDKQGAPIYEGRMSDFDWSPNEEAAKNAKLDWERNVEGVENGYKPSFYKPEYFIDQYGDKETYMRYSAHRHTYAVITPDGEWHQLGNMGWWGCSDETGEDRRAWVENFDARFIEKYQDAYAYIIDCHI